MAARKNNGASLDFETLKTRLLAFRDERDWKQFHDPKNLAEAIVIEAAELLEVFLWGDPGISRRARGSGAGVWSCNPAQESGRSIWWDCRDADR
jgi:hypothetical protein